MMFWLYAKDDEYLDTKEVALRIIQSFPTSRVDWERGNRKVACSLQNLVAMNVPEVILTSHRSLFDKTAYVEISSPQFPNQTVELFLSPYSRLELKSGIPEAEELLRHVAVQLASVLNYASKEIYEEPN
jgi:hypothetical protein